MQPIRSSFPRFHFAGDYQLEIASVLGMGRVSMSFSSSAPPGAGDVQALCMLPQSLGVHEL